MKKFLKEHYKAILVPVIAILLATILIWAAKTVVSGKTCGKLVGFLFTKVDLPFYLLVLIFIVGLAIPLFIKKLKSPKSRFGEYNRDEVNGLVWEWSNYVFPRLFTPLCPKCLAELLVKSSPQNQYICVSCGFQKQCNYDHSIMEKIVKIEIEKRERTSEWKNAKRRIARAKSDCL